MNEKSGMASSYIEITNGGLKILSSRPKVIINTINELNAKEKYGNG